MTKALADRLAEAFAEYLHKEARIAWGFGREEQLSNTDLIREKYRGIRPAAGYPACPDHAEKRTLFDLLDAENNTGIKLTESFAMHPGASVSGLYFSHPESKYFGVGQIGHDQAVDYATRRSEAVLRSGKTTRAEFGVTLSGDRAPRAGKGEALNKERRLGQPSQFEYDGWEAVTPWISGREDLNLRPVAAATALL